MEVAKPTRLQQQWILANAVESFLSKLDIQKEKQT